MATLTGQTEFARRVIALGMTLGEVAEATGYSLRTLESVSIGRRALTKRLDIALKRIEDEKTKTPAS